MSGANVVRLRGGGRSAVLKRSSTAVETCVYTDLAAQLRDAGIGLPELYAAWHGDGAWWLLLEDVPHPLPRERWEADPEQIAMLRRLHRIDARSLTTVPRTYRPEWPQAMTDAALSLFDPKTGARLNDTLAPIVERASRLFGPRCVISGDPNPANWGLRDDGSLVLFDWERCTLATPAIDLAITVPGLGSQAVFERVAAVYGSSSVRAQDIAHAKAWSVIEFLAGYARGDIEPSFQPGPLLEVVPAWLGEISSIPGM